MTCTNYGVKYEPTALEIAAWVSNIMEQHALKEARHHESPAFSNRCELYKRCMEEEGTSTGRD